MVVSRDVSWSGRREKVKGTMAGVTGSGVGKITENREGQRDKQTT